MTLYSLYVHIPFCRHRCAYCDFNTYAGLEDLIPAYVRALCNEARILRDGAGEGITLATVYFGGGTPSLLPAEEIERILACLQECFDLQSGVEISLEANPGSINLEGLRRLRRAGVNRISFGMQSANSDELRLLERQHDFGDVIRAVGWARHAGFDNLNLDLIFALPGQSLASWQASLVAAASLHPEHLSLYALTLEHGTPMLRWVERGLVPTPDADLAADMYEWASEYLDGMGYCQYEISNWARRDAHGVLLACQHNLTYWHNQPYLGLGAGAHGFAARMRLANVLSPQVYIQRCLQPPDDAYTFPRSPANASIQLVDRQTEITETMMMSLRLTQEGVSRRAFYARFGEELDHLFAEAIADLIAVGLLEWAGEEQDVLRLTPRGRLLGNQVFMRFI